MGSYAILRYLINRDPVSSLFYKGGIAFLASILQKIVFGLYLCYNLTNTKIIIYLKEKMKKNTKSKADLFFEVSWEVCNKVGGIFTVLSSKARHMQKCYRNGYYLVGPYFEGKSRAVFKEEAVPEKYKNICEQLKEEGTICHFGFWLIKGEPKVILVDFKDLWSKINNIKKELWENFKLDSLDSSYDFDEPVLWSWAVGNLIEKLSEVESNKKIVVQAHEWLSGPAILYLKKNDSKVSTVFTTHATTLGRSLAGHGADLYSVIDKIDPTKEAQKYGVAPKHNMEKITAAAAHVFTTVSQVTAVEAEYILGKKADVILPNGLDMTKFPSFEETALKHKKYRDKLRQFALYYFFPYYKIDLKDTLFYFTASRYEFHNKGLDIFIESLARLNEKMKKNKSKKTVVTFFFVPAGVEGIRTEVAEAREAFRDIKDLLEEEENDIKENLLYALTSEERISEKSVFDKGFSLNMKRKLLRLKSKSGAAPLSTHKISDAENDPIIKAFKNAGLENKEEDKVKVIFYPIYLTGADGLGDLDYYQSIQACHLGIFPSYYEPWGYTPLETGALGVASLTSNLSGFGKYFYDDLRNKKIPGIYILDIENQKKEKMIKDFVDIIYKYTLFTKKKRIDNKIQARKVAFTADWKNFAVHYIEAHNLAVEKNI
ncbi:MAG: glycogen/starch synthase [Candidatus Pacebacteria bacterium]|nr:glycogen/starch synthase [Candidatus Paceibacterota bacterium]